MKKFLPIIILVLLAGGAAAYMMTKEKDTDKANQTTSTENQSDDKKFSPPVACKVFTLDDAKKVLGDSVEATELPGGGGASSADIEVSQCLYSQPGGDTLASIKSMKQASILVRGAKTQTGADSNDEVFNGSLKPAEAEDVSGYGNAAYWNPQFGQLNIYKNGNWYILSVGVTNPGEKTLDEAKALADILIDKL